MLISEAMNASLNGQVGEELGASNHYINIAGYFDEENLPILSAFFFRQSNEERLHALRFVRYVLDAGGKAAIPAIEAGPSEFESAEAAAAAALEWELAVTEMINKLMDQAIKENDHTTQQFLRWFVDEQLEEVSTMEELLGVVQRAGEGGLLFVEQYLANQPAPSAPA